MTEQHKRKLNKLVGDGKHQEVIKNLLSLDLPVNQKKEVYGITAQFKQFDTELRKGVLSQEQITYWAMFYGSQNDKANALVNLQKAIDLGLNDLDWLETEETLNCLRKDKTFKKIVKTKKRDERKNN